MGTPQIVPLVVPKSSPEGRVVLMPQLVMAPAPVTVGLSGRLGCAELFVKVRLLGS